MKYNIENKNLNMKIESINRYMLLSSMNKAHITSNVY